MAIARGGGGAPSPDRAGRLPAAVFGLLVLACFAAFFVTQRLKHTPTLVQRVELTPRFSPYGTLHDRQERISFKLASADQVTVAIVDGNGDVVATLVRDHPVQRYKQLSLRWNGRRGTAHHVRVLLSASGHRTLLPLNTGPLAPPGEYRIRLTLLREGSKPVEFPRSFVLVGR